MEQLLLYGENECIEPISNQRRQIDIFRHLVTLYSVFIAHLYTAKLLHLAICLHIKKYNRCTLVC